MEILSDSLPYESINLCGLIFTLGFDCKIELFLRKLFDRQITDLFLLFGVYVPLEESSLLPISPIDHIPKNGDPETVRTSNLQFISLLFS